MPWTLVFGPSLPKDCGKVTWNEKDVKEYWDHWEQFGNVEHPATKEKKHIPVGIAGDDAKYTLAGAKIIVMLLNFPVQEVMRFMAELPLFHLALVFGYLLLFISTCTNMSQAYGYYKDDPNADSDGGGDGDGDHDDKK